MNNEQGMSSTYQPKNDMATVPKLVGKVLNDPQDEAEEAMALVIRDAALTQQAAEYLLAATRAADERFAHEAAAGLDRVATTAKAVQAKYTDPDNEIDMLMKGAMKGIVGSQIDSVMRQKDAHVGISGEIADAVQSLPSIRGKMERKAAAAAAAAAAAKPTVIYQQAPPAPKFRPAGFFEGGQKFVREQE